MIHRVPFIISSPVVSPTLCARRVSEDDAVDNSQSDREGQAQGTKRHSTIVVMGSDRVIRY